MFIALGIFLYIIGSGISFVILGEKTTPHDYWETPGPFFGSFVWPLIFPMLIGETIGKKLVRKGPTKEEKQIKAAQHKLELARIEAATTAELEKALHNAD